MLLLGAVFLLSDTYSPTKASPVYTAQSLEPVWGPDIQVNPTVISTPAAQRNYSMAINPTNPNNILASYDGLGTHSTLSSYARSRDAGRTWTNDYFEGPWGSQGLSPLGGGNVAFDSRGTAYYVGMGVNTSMSGYFVLTSTNMTTWSTPVPIVVSTYDQYRSQSVMVSDKDATSPFANSIYMFWAYTNNVPPYVQGIICRYSRDGGLTWSADIQVSDPGHEYSTGATAVVASNGVLYASFQQLDGNFIGNAPHLY